MSVRLDRQIAAARKRVTHLTDRIGELMTRRVDAEDRLAELLTSRALAGGKS